MIEKNIIKPNYILIFSGGGIEGLINHLGFYKAFSKFYYNTKKEENAINIPVVSSHTKISRIIGTSAGAIIGAFISAGYSYKDLEHIFLYEFLNYNLLKIIDNPFNIFEDGALLKNTPILLLYKRYLPSTFEALPVSFTAIATEMDTGKLKRFNKGNLPLAIMASQSIPVVFPYVKINDHYYLDGAIVRNMENRLIYQYITYVSATNKKIKKEEDKYNIILVDMDKHIDDIDISYNPLQILYNANRICRKYYEQFDYEKIKDIPEVTYLLKEVQIKFSIKDFINIHDIRLKIKEELNRLSDIYYTKLISK